MNFGRLIVVGNKVLMVKKFYKTAGKGRLLLIPHEFLVAAGFPEYVKMELDKTTKSLVITPCTEEEGEEYINSFLLG